MAAGAAGFADSCAVGAAVLCAKLAPAEAQSSIEAIMKRRIAILRFVKMSGWSKKPRRVYNHSAIGARRSGALQGGILRPQPWPRSQWRAASVCKMICAGVAAIPHAKVYEQHNWKFQRSIKSAE